MCLPTAAAACFYRAAISVGRRFAGSPQRDIVPSVLGSFTGRLVHSNSKRNISSRRGCSNLLTFNNSYRAVLEAEIADEVAAPVFDDDGAFQALERGLGVFVAERGRLLEIAFGGVGVLRS